MKNTNKKQTQNQSKKLFFFAYLGQSRIAMGSMPSVAEMNQMHVKNFMCRKMSSGFNCPFVYILFFLF